MPFHDLRRRWRALRPSLKARLDEVLGRGRLILGGEVAAFEGRFARWCGMAHGVGVASGTDAVWLALAAAGVGPGDEVVTVANTCAPTIAGVLKTGAVPVLVDVDPRTMTMDPERAEAAVTRRTKCLLPVHLYGRLCDMDALLSVARRRRLKVVEDCAQAHGAEQGGRRAGSFGDLAAFSFYPTKNLGALGDGGMVLAREAAAARRLRLLRQYGYRRPNVSSMAGFNSRLDELQASFLLAALPGLEPGNARRCAIARSYGRAFAGRGLDCPEEPRGGRHAWHLYVVQARRREALRRGLAADGIETMVHYPVPIHRQRGYAERCRVGRGGLAVTERLARSILSLPLYPEMTPAEVSAVERAVLRRLP